ncbi:TPA: hypothetical protein I9081_002251 [Clostridium perfringens]|uniref:hypothetical protein n=1 Tax=Clostridium perfringens TaxID=1502 RepID=UPI000B373C29|nr:hypothetical protein [Clostridium perfringens]OUN50346.1 hypothetical protein B5G18_14365 [Clostridium perfringens]OUP41634.1 hypothetical protein B5F20_14390 [Clostridium perfringens]UBK59489.1 hypothetical protein KLF43_13735 [Clostridium perfringens]UBK67483.1 hypothetical protein KLF46_13695 [Clostridium perfringens]CAG9368255.1 Uncharacterised protein [Clostridium perfringens]
MKTKKRLSPISIFISIILLLSLILLCFKISGKRFNTTKIEETKEVETQFPYNVEFDNYKVQINKPKLFNHYVLFDYNVETKDGSPIEEGDFNITGSVKFPDKAYFISSDNILNEINNNKMHIVDVGIIVARENYDLYVKNPSFLVNAREKGSSKLIYEEKRIDKRIETKGIIYPTKENYKEINKTFKLDNIDFNILSLGNFDFGSFIPIFIGNISHEQSEEISNKYAIRIKCGNLNQIYNLEKWAGFYEKAIKNYSKIDSKYNKNSEYDQFYMAKILYNPNEVSRDNMEIYLINKNTNEEVKIN